MRPRIILIAVVALALHLSEVAAYDDDNPMTMMAGIAIEWFTTFFEFCKKFIFSGLINIGGSSGEAEVSSYTRREHHGDKGGGTRREYHGESGEETEASSYTRREYHGDGGGDEEHEASVRESDHGSRHPKGTLEYITAPVKHVSSKLVNLGNLGNLGGLL